MSEFLETFKKFPPRQRAASFTIDRITDKMTNAAFRSGRLSPRVSAVADSTGLTGSGWTTLRSPTRRLRGSSIATGYVTTAERARREQDYPGAKPELLVAGSFFVQPVQGVDLRNHFNW